MKLINVEIVPGIIYNSSDPEKLGRVKASAPGLFDNNSMHDEAIPWLYPWLMCGYQHFSKMTNGSKIWIIVNKDNLHECYYMPLLEYIDVARKYLDENYNNSPDILVFRNNGFNVASLTYDTINGFKESILDSYIQLKPSNEIELNANEANITMAGNHINIGNKNAKFEQAVLGNTLYKILYDLQSSMRQLQQLSMANPFTISLGPGFEQAITALDPIDTILAPNTSVN